MNELKILRKSIYPVFPNVYNTITTYYNNNLYSCNSLQVKRKKLPQFTLAKKKSDLFI